MPVIISCKRYMTHEAQNFLLSSPSLVLSLLIHLLLKGKRAIVFCAVSEKPEAHLFLYPLLPFASYLSQNTYNMQRVNSTSGVAGV